MLMVEEQYFKEGRRRFSAQVSVYREGAGDGRGSEWSRRSRPRRGNRKSLHWHEGRRNRATTLSMLRIVNVQIA